VSEEFNESANAHVNRDQAGVVRDVLHLEGPYVSTAPTAQLAAQDYLQQFRALFGISHDELHSMSAVRAERAEPTDVEYRFLTQKTQFDTTTVTFSQTCLGLPVWAAGLSVQLRQDPFRVISAQSTVHTDVRVAAPSEETINRLVGLDEQALARSLGLSEQEERFDRASLAIERRELYVYRYEADQRVREPDQVTERGEESLRHSHQNPPLPAVPGEIVASEHYVVAAVYFTLGTPAIPGLRWVALVEAETLAVLMLRAFVASVQGMVFTQEPVTTNGGPSPNAPEADLDALRTSVLLPGLDPPSGGSYALLGPIVAVKDVEAPAIAPPTEPSGTDFDFTSRTDNFAAVNAYYHADRFFRLVQELGFDLNVYFGGTLFPTAVDHRGLGGATINAHCLGNGSFGILETAFALADLTDVAHPLGIACDYRVVLHELAGHGTLYNHVNGPNFGFAHSAGDSVAVVLNDYDTRAPDRFVSFPWVNIGRRHDRTPAAGWGWAGNIALHPFGPPDPGGYDNEQILATTHFRIYRSIGGDSTEPAVREFAGRYVAYLILRTIAGLTSATNPPSATAYATNLIASDLGNWTSADQVGGCYWKVVRWAFEKQGLYQPPATPKPNNEAGTPPPVDVYIDDGRNGEYPYVAGDGYYSPQRFWETTQIWNRHHPDGKLDHQTPVVGRANYAYVRVKNRGTLAAANITVSGWHSRPSAGLVWPDDFSPMTTASRTLASLPSGSETVVGPFEWRPSVPGHECMLMSASTPGDLANNDPASGLAAASGPTPLWRLVPCDNNLGLRAVVPVPGGGHRDHLVQAFRDRRFWASNPFAHTAKMEIRPVLPSFLASRGWAVRLDNAGGGSFSLGPRDSRAIEPRLISGQDFTALEIQAAGYVAIEFDVLADGLTVGGLTYVLEAEMREPAEEAARDEQEEHHRPEQEEHHRLEQEDDDQLRRVRVDIDLD
jgi:hypothetical protein